MQLSTLIRRDAPLLPHLRCPLCGGALRLSENRSLLCESGHCYDLSAKGYVNFAPGHRQATDKYTAALFDSRARVFADGFYAPVAQALCEAVAHWSGPALSQDARVLSDMPQSSAPAEHAGRVAPSPSPAPVDGPLILDAGCGEGYYARALSQSPLHPCVVGVDISREAILAAARQSTAPEFSALHWLVADLTRLPFAPGAFDAIVDVLTPADYREFARLLRPEGVLYKIVPADDYLFEIRQAVAGSLRGEDFSNARVIDHLAEHARIVSRIPVRHTYPVTPEQAGDFLRMTPLTFGLSDERRASVHLTQITVAMELLVCRPQRKP